MKILKISLAIIVLLSVIYCKKDKPSANKDLLAVNSENSIKVTEVKSGKYFRIW